MTPIEALREAAEELRQTALSIDHKRQPNCPGFAGGCQRCRWLRLADDCERSADELERSP